MSNNDDAILSALEGDSWLPMLESVPVRNDAAKVEKNDDGTITATVKLKGKAPYLPPISWFIKRKDYRDSRLDLVGTSLWKMCDGEKKTELLIDEFSKKHRLTFHEARVSVWEYLKILVRRGIVVIEVKN